MLRGDVILCTDVHPAHLVSAQRDICEWAQKHNSGPIRWSACNGTIITHCAVDPAEFNADGYLKVGIYDAFMESAEIIPEPKKDVEASVARTLRNFLTELFQASNMSEAEQQAVLNMPVGQFCTVWDDTFTQISYHGVEEASPLSRRMLLSHIRDVICPKCGFKGVLRIMDGLVFCEHCAAEFGDIDDIPN